MTGRFSREFQLTHSRGVRQSVLADLSPQLHFNSRTHVECDKITLKTCRFLVNFNSRTHVECDITETGKNPKTKNFNSRTHVECDEQNVATAQMSAHFNSRTHVECDSKYCIKKRFTTQYMGIYCFLSSIILIFFIYSKK